MPRNKSGKVALVTGAKQGLGLAFAQRLADEGATVVALDLEEAHNLEEELRTRSNAPSMVLQADITSAQEVGNAVERITNTFGRCDILVNNAGINTLLPFTKVDFDTWRKVMAVNVDGMFLMCKAVIGSMIASGYGRIVNIASDTLGHPFGEVAHYMASKGAVIGLTRGLANEVGIHSITVNCIAPGFTRTPRTEEVPQAIFDAFVRMQPIKREAVPDDIVGAMSFLTSQEASFVTGQTLIVNGGILKSL